MMTRTLGGGINHITSFGLTCDDQGCLLKKSVFEIVNFIKLNAKQHHLRSTVTWVESKEER